LASSKKEEERNSLKDIKYLNYHSLLRFSLLLQIQKRFFIVYWNNFTLASSFFKEERNSSIRGVGSKYLNYQLLLRFSLLIL
jgi:hypothetical protein